MRSLIIAFVAMFALVDATGASAAATGPGPTWAATCVGGAASQRPPRRPPRCYRVSCPLFIRRCPPGEVWGKRHPTDCCNDACVKRR
jgi:hypothetical protein